MLLLPALLSLTACAQSRPAQPEPDPAQDEEPAHAQWIWAGEARKNESVWFRRSFELGEARSAWLEASCDDRTAIWINGRLAFEVNGWKRPCRAEVTALLVPGRNVLAAWGQNDRGHAGLQLALEVELADGRREIVFTDERWPCTREEPAEGWIEVDFDDSRWDRARELGAAGIAQPWGQLDPAVEPDRSQVLQAAELELPPGFTAELVYAVPRERQGSWVAATFDDRGRLIASDQYGPFYRLELPAAGSVARAERIDVELGEAQGLCFAFGSLYAVVSHGARFESGLYRVRDTDGDDRYDQAERLCAFLGESGEHGPHAVRLAPDGRSLYVIGGNHTDLPQPILRARVTPVWGEDQLLAIREDPNGHAVGRLAPGGWLCRTDPDGRSWELVAAGMRNAYDFDFDPEGEPFTFDSDMEWDIGLPWYRPTRICHLVSGVDFGWRQGSGKWPPVWPDSLPGAVDVGLSSPTGVAFGARSRFPEPWRSALFAADWAYGTIYAVHLEPRGASYGGRCEVFARGRPFPVTDLEFGPDGALYVVTGGRRTRSGVYRIRWSGDGAESAGPGAIETEASTARARRRELERWHGLRDPAAIEDAWPELASADRFLRHAARVAVEHQDLAWWQERALAESRPLARVQALLALVRLAPPGSRPRLLEAWERLPIESMEPAERIDALRVLQLLLIRMGAGDLAEARRLAARLDALYPARDAEEDRDLARLLAALQAPGFAAKTVPRLESDPSRESQIHYAFCLRDVREGWTLDLRRRYFLWMDGIAWRLRGGASLSKYLDGLRADVVGGLDEAERAALRGLLEPPAREAARSTEPARLVRAWNLRDLEPELGRLARGRSFEKGRAAFAKALCLDCHRFAGEGASSGPDLTGAGGRFGARDLLEAIVSPSAAISDQYQDTEVLTVDDRIYVGRVVEENETRLVLRTAPPVEQDLEIDPASVALRRPHPLSRMPEGLIDVLTVEEILDLIAYVLSGGDSSRAEFRP